MQATDSEMDSSVFGWVTRAFLVCPAQNSFTCLQQRTNDYIVMALRGQFIKRPRLLKFNAMYIRPSAISDISCQMNRAGQKLQECGDKFETVG